MAEEYLTDDEQLEVVKHAIVEYAPWLIGGALIGAALFFGYRYYGSFTTERGLKAAAQFGQLSAALQANDHPRSWQLAEGLVKDYASTPYADQAQLAIARLNVEDGHPDKAIAPLTLVMNNSKDTELRQIARLRIARILIDQGKSDEAIKLLSEGTPGSFAGRYHEVHGDALYAKKDPAGAAAEYKAALGAADAGGLDAALLDLKIQDLGAAAAPVASISADTSKKAKP
jgi:predicted negative regulator of RcsB-dependent stress response